MLCVPPVNRRRKPARPRKGAMLVLIAVTILLLVIAAAFSIDVAFMQLTRTQLRTSTDAAARAANEALSRSQTEAAARAAARTAAAANPVAGAPLQLDDADIIFGHANVQSDGKYDFSADARPYNSVRVVGRRNAWFALRSSRPALRRRVHHAHV